MTNSQLFLQIMNFSLKNLLLWRRQINLIIFNHINQTFILYFQNLQLFLHRSNFALQLLHSSTWTSRRRLHHLHHIFQFFDSIILCKKQSLPLIDSLIVFLFERMANENVVLTVVVGIRVVLLEICSVLDLHLYYYNY